MIHRTAVTVNCHMPICTFVQMGYKIDVMIGCHILSMKWQSGCPMRHRTVVTINSHMPVCTFV